MTQHGQQRPLTTQLTLTVLALALFGLLTVGVFGVYAVVHTDRVSLARQRLFVEDGIKDQFATLRREQETVAVWDDAILFARAGDQAWMSDNLGLWLNTYYGHDRIFVLDPKDQPIHVVRDGETLPAAALGDEERVIQPLIAEARARLARGADADAANDPEDLVVEDLVMLGSRPAIVSVAPLVPSSQRLTQAPGTEYLHVSMQYVDDTLVGHIARQYQLSGARYVPAGEAAPGLALVPLTDAAGAALGYVGWQPERPGMALVRQAAPAIGLALALGLGMLFFLLRRLRRASSQLQRSQDQAQYLAFHDTLTGLPNRALFEDRLKRALVAAGRERGKIALLYLDLDRFKHVNDTLGHPAGDELVRQASARLERAVRAVDTVARLGGDEFAVILVGIRDARNAEDICEELLQQFGLPFRLLDDQVFISASIGVAIAPDSAADSEDLLRKADIALYEAKRNGRGRYQVFAGDMDDIVLRKRLIESDLRAALIAGEQISLDYQPVFGADGRSVVGAEALIRWNHPVHGELPPAHFISIAEERGMIGLLGDQVLAMAARFGAESRLPWIAVNVSPLQLRDEGFAANLFAILDEAGLEPGRLQIEITESVLLENNAATRSVLAELRGRGVRIALDDFGTGYSSINYLRRHAIDKLKIDRSFVRMLDGDERAAAIVKALIELGRAVRVKVTAEGVETAEQRDRLVAMGCDELQGFLLSPPLDAATMLSWAAPAAAVRTPPAASAS